MLKPLLRVEGVQSRPHGAKKAVSRGSALVALQEHSPLRRGDDLAQDHTSWILCAEKEEVRLKDWRWRGLARGGQAKAILVGGDLLGYGMRRSPRTFDRVDGQAPDSAWCRQRQPANRQDTMIRRDGTTPTRPPGAKQTNKHQRT
eukprot:scaffold12482_cov110-Isochrysis_galbana.AAC.2